MDRLAAHVIATAALTVTLATVPVLFADASHAAAAPAAAAPAAVTAAYSPTCHAHADYFFAPHRLHRRHTRPEMAPAVYEERRGPVAGTLPPDRLCA